MVVEAFVLESCSAGVVVEASTSLLWKLALVASLLFCCTCKFNGY
jgi:hypothetical protein